MDAHDAPRDLMRYFNDLQDPRMDRTRLHRLSDIIAIALLAVVCGADNWVEVAAFGRAKQHWLETILALPNGIPSHDTFGRVFGMLDPEAFEACFLKWIRSLIEVTGDYALHIDGKTLRRSFDAASSTAAIHMVSAWASKYEAVLGQVATDARSNEITAIPRLLDLITVHGAVVTIDAMGCQREIARKIIDGQGDYILAVKDNQPTLYEDVKLLLDEGIEHDFEHMGYDFHEEIEKGHGRIETRRVWVTREVDWLRERGDWVGLRSVICVESVREVIVPGGENKVSVQRRYFISSLDHRDKAHDASFFARHVRGHWGVENKLHWSLDVGFNEDGCRVRQGNAAENFSRLRRITLNLLKKEETAKIGIHAKRLKCGWDHRYLLKVLGMAD